VMPTSLYLFWVVLYIF